MTARKLLILTAIPASIILASACTKKVPKTDQRQVEISTQSTKHMGRAFEQINLDRWTQTILTHANTKTQPLDSTTIATLFKDTLSKGDADWLQSFYSNLLIQVPKLETKADYFGLSEALFSARNQIRVIEPLSRARIAVPLLTTLVDEVLYAASLKLNDLPLEWTWSPESESDLTCTGTYHDSRICSGDVILSKSDAFSSSLFMFRNPYAFAFSHAGLAASNVANAIDVIDADLPGRQIKPLNRFDGFPRMAIYRAKKGKIAGARVAAWVTRSYKFEFNYALKPACEPDRYFCTEFIDCAFKESGAPELTPFPKNLWSDGEKNEPGLAEFIDGISSEMYWGKIPLPGDMEFNQNFELVKYFVRIPALENLRVRSAVVNAAIELLSENATLRKAYLSRIRDLSGPNPSKGALAALPTEGLQTFVKKYDKKLNPKQIVFYFHFQSTLIPKVFGELQRTTHLHPTLLGDLYSEAKKSVEKEIDEFIRN